MRRAIFLVIFFLSISHFQFKVSGAVISVPADYTTIQHAIDVSVDGDTVLVANGTYRGLGNVDLTFEGKAITVMSENGPEFCTIDCQGNGRGFSFHSRENAASIVDGFTITRGIYVCAT